MNKDFTITIYAEPLRWIRRKRERGAEWEDIANQPSSKPLLHAGDGVHERGLRGEGALEAMRHPRPGGQDHRRDGEDPAQPPLQRRGLLDGVDPRDPRGGTTGGRRLVGARGHGAELPPVLRGDEDRRGEGSGLQDVPQALGDTPGRPPWTGRTGWYCFVRVIPSGFKALHFRVESSD